MKASCTVWSRGKDKDSIKILPIAIKDLENENLQVYRLVYEPITARQDEFPLGAGRNQGLRYIDAYSGEPIWERRLVLGLEKV